MKSRVDVLRFFKWLYVTVWQLLRLVTLICLSMFFSLVALVLYVAGNAPDQPLPEPDGRPGIVCGKMANAIVEISRRYVIFWPEYEGKSSWEEGFFYNKKGCDANLTSLTLYVSWPEFYPMEDGAYFDELRSGDEYSGLVVSISPMRSKGDDMTWFLERYKSLYVAGAENGEFYDEELDLFFFEVASAGHSKVAKRVYWYVNNEGIPVVFKCNYSGTSKEVSSCDGKFIMDDPGYLIELGFSGGKLMRWSELIEGTKKFILNRVNR